MRVLGMPFAPATGGIEFSHPKADHGPQRKSLILFDFDGFARNGQAPVAPKFEGSTKHGDRPRLVNKVLRNMIDTPFISMVSMNNQIIIIYI